MNGMLNCTELFTFAYEDCGGKHLPRPNENADVVAVLPKHIWELKYNLITNVYGFSRDSFEARTTPKKEAFWQFGGRNRI